MTGKLPSFFKEHIRAILNLTVYNGPSKVYCIKLERIAHQYIKGRLAPVGVVIGFSSHTS